MLLCHSWDDLAALRQPIFWALGFFDGVHRGHQRVIRAASAPSALRGVLTFEQHPLSLLAPERQPRLLTPDARIKAALLEKAGADILLSLPFTPQLAALPPALFLDKLSAACQVAGISVGSNWHFGQGGAGNTDFLQTYAAEHGFPALIHPLLQEGGYPVCSSRIRHKLAKGRLLEATALLGHPLSLTGIVEHGQRLARQLGFPTANITLPSQAALPPYGVYEVESCLFGTRWQGIANIGLRPTIQEKDKSVRAEVHFPGWHGDLYGHNLTLHLQRMIRPERRFPSLEALQAQIAADIREITRNTPC